jgi:hypothetical protein
MNARVVERFALLILLILLGAGTALAQSPGSLGDGSPSWVGVVGPLILSLLLAGGAAFALRTRLRGILPPLDRRERRLRLVESLRISHQTDLYLVELDGRELLVAATAQGTTLLLDRGERPR